MAAEKDRVSNSAFLREFFSVYKSIVSVALTLYLFICANLPNEFIMLHFQISALSPYMSCVSLCFVSSN